MTTGATATINSVFHTYTKHFVSQYADIVLSQSAGDIEIDPTLKNEVLSGAVESFFANNDLDPSAVSINSMSKFVYECAEAAATSDQEDILSAETYGELSQVSSNYHSDLNDHAVIASGVYNSILNDVVVDVLAKDAHDTVKLITAKAQNEIQQSKTGARVHGFGWGILSDGLWLNSALMKAYDLASIFRPGDEVKRSHATTAFNMANNFGKVPEAKESHAEEFGLIVTSSEESTKNLLEGDLDKFNQVKRLLLSPGFLSASIDRWEKGTRDPELLISNIAELSELAVTLPALSNSVRNLVAEDMVSQELESRIEAINNAVTLCLAGFEVIRETTYKDSLIMYVNSDKEDPVVDVFVNQENVDGYVRDGGDEADVMMLGMYLDPRRGIEKSNGGWSTEWAAARRVGIISSMMEEEQERERRLRNNEALILERISTNAITNLATSYGNSAGLESLNPVTQASISRLAREASRPGDTAKFSLEGKIVELLSDVVGNEKMTNVAKTFISNITSQDEAKRLLAKELTILEMAATDALRHMYGMDSAA